MTLDDYQRAAMTTAVYPRIGSNLNYAVVGLGGEVGELLNKFQKLLRGDYAGDHDGGGGRAELAGELEGALWFCAAVATELGVSLEDVARRNLDRLASRAERGVIRGNGDER